MAAIAIVAACLFGSVTQAQAQAPPDGQTTVSLPADLASGPVSVAQDGRRLSFRLIGARGAVNANGGRATVKDALPGVTVRYSSIPGGVKEDLVIARRSAAPKAFHFDLETTPGLELHLTRDRRILAADEGRRVRMLLPAPFMFDSRKPKAARSNSVGVSLRRLSASTYRLTLEPSRKWLASDARRWPVTVDPTTSTVVCCHGCPVELDQCVPNPTVPGEIPPPQCDLDDPRRFSTPPGCREIPPAVYLFKAADPNRRDGEVYTICTVTMEAGAGRLQGREIRHRTTTACDNRMNTIDMRASIFDGSRSRGTAVSRRCQMHTAAPCSDPARLTTPIGHVTGLVPGRYEQRVTIYMKLPNSAGDPWTVVPAPGNPPDTRCAPLVGTLEVTCNLVQEINLEADDLGLPLQETKEVLAAAVGGVPKPDTYCVKYPTAPGCPVFVDPKP